MGAALDLLQAAAGEGSLHSKLGQWRQSVSVELEAVRANFIGVQIDLDQIRAVLNAAPTSFPGYDGAPPNVGTASSAGVSLLVSRSDHTHGHGDLPGGTLHAVATPAIAGFMSVTDKVLLDALVAGAPYVQDVVEMYGPGAGHVQGVAVTPGWTVLEPGAFLWSNALSDPYVQAIFRSVFLVTDASMTGRVRLFDVTAGVPVATSVVSSSSLTDVTQTTANILGDLIDGHLYQFQAEATGTAAGSAFVFVRSAVLICQL